MRLFIRQAPTHATGSSQKLFLMEFLLFDILERESSFNHLVSESENLTTDVMFLIDLNLIVTSPKNVASNSNEFRICDSVLYFRATDNIKPTRAVNLILEREVPDKRPLKEERRRSNRES